MDESPQNINFGFRLSVVAAGTAVAWICFYGFVKIFGGPAMFSMAYAPATAADPERNFHFAMAWILIYSVLGLSSGFIGAIGNSKLKHTPAAVLPVLVFIAIRSYGKINFYGTEEGHCGIPAAIAMSLVGGLLWLLAAFAWKRIFGAKNTPVY